MHTNYDSPHTACSGTYGGNTYDGNGRNMAAQEAAVAMGIGGVERYVVAYAKIVMDKDEGISLQGVYFGGIGNTMAEAEGIARECVNSARGGTILPKIFRLEGEGRLVDVMQEATQRFEKLAANMIEADQIISRSRKRK